MGTPSSGSTIATQNTAHYNHVNDKQHEIISHFITLNSASRGDYEASVLGLDFSNVGWQALTEKSPVIEDTKLGSRPRKKHLETQYLQSSARL
jgi:hypothetical protein